MRMSRRLPLLAAMLGLLATAQPSRAGHHAKDCAAPCEPCPPATRKTCVPEPDQKKVTKTVYDCECEDFCLPKCPKFSLHSHKKGCDKDCGGCADGACASCEKPRTRKVLIKKFVTHEECGVKCSVQEVPACAPCPLTTLPAPEHLHAPAGR